MKIWLVICLALSGCLFFLQVSSIQSCSKSYAVDDSGGLIRDPRLETCSDCTPACKGHLRGDVSDWSQMPEFDFVADRVQRGDRLVYTTKRVAEIWAKGPSMSELEVSRGDDPPAVYRHNGLLFWAVILLWSSLPMLFWTVGALIAVTTAPRPRQPALEAA